MKRLFFLLAVWLAIPFQAWAAPAVTGTSGTWSHNGTVTISGSGFLTKSPAAPVFWDACDATSPSSISTLYAGTNLPNCSDANGDDVNITEMTAHYTSSYPDAGGTPMAMPHSRVTKYIAGANTSCYGAFTNSYNTANIVFTRTGWPARKLYTMYWYRISPTFSLKNSADSSNMKEIAVNPPPNGAYLDGPPQQYIDWCNSGIPPEENPNDAIMRCSVPENTSGCVNYPLSIPNPMQGWVHMELAWDETGYRWAYSNGTEAGTNGALCSYTPFRSDYMTVSWGGFTRIPLQSITGNYRYFAGIYADSTFSRVMIGNAATWAASTKREVQIPSAWATGSITVTANLGSFSDGAAYLYVFDSTNTPNTAGYPITLGACTGDGDCNDGNTCTTDTCVAQVCQHANNTAACDDGAFCNGVDTCSGGSCVSAGDPCTALADCNQICNETANNCYEVLGTACDSDSIPNTVDACNGYGACVHTPTGGGPGCVIGGTAGGAVLR